MCEEEQNVEFRAGKRNTLPDGGN